MEWSFRPQAVYWRLYNNLYIGSQARAAVHPGVGWVLGNPGTLDPSPPKNRGLFRRNVHILRVCQVGERVNLEAMDGNTQLRHDVYGEPLSAAVLQQVLG